MAQWKNKSIKDLFRAITSLESEKETSAFMRDLATIAELRSMAERWQVAQMIEKGIPYRKIAEKTGVSTTTITRVAHWINEGEGGYKKMLEKR
jgi:TrpR-related protein YerC/YecD